MVSLAPHVIERERMERRLERERLERDQMDRERMERDRLERLEKEKLLQNAERAEREKVLQAVEQREKLLHTSGYLGLAPFTSGVPPHPSLSLLDRRIGFVGAPSAYPFLDRPPVPTSMWSPFDKSPADLAQRIELDRERERMALLSRLSGMPSHLAALEQERMKEQILREQHSQELRRQYLDRLPHLSADRLRAVDPLALGAYFPRPISPMFSHGIPGIKSNSPASIPGVPPPLIPSSNSATSAMLSSLAHDNSPSSSSKSKGCSPADSTSDLKDKRDTRSTDPDAHSR